MARNVLPWFGPLTPLICIVLGFLVGSTEIVPSSFGLADITSYLLPLIDSLNCLAISRGISAPLISALSIFQAPARAFSSAEVSCGEAGTSKATQTRDSIGL